MVSVEAALEGDRPVVGIVPAARGHEGVDGAGGAGLAAGRSVVLVGPDGLGTVPMRMPAGVCGLTVTGVALRDGVAVSFTGMWRASYGPAYRCVGDVVLELMAPVTRLERRVRSGPETERVRICVSVARRSRWVTVADVQDAGLDWPYQVALLAVLAGAPLRG